ncbi:MAG: hypothetical protein U0791_18895 [Gemmataceae bacterium]
MNRAGRIAARCCPGEEDVARLEVTVDDALVVGSLYAASDFLDQCRG